MASSALGAAKNNDESELNAEKMVPDDRVLECVLDRWLLLPLLLPLLPLRFRTTVGGDDSAEDEEDVGTNTSAATESRSELRSSTGTEGDVLPDVRPTAAPQRKQKRAFEVS
jgi:hypothetical protein